MSDEYAVLARASIKDGQVTASLTRGNTVIQLTCPRDDLDNAANLITNSEDAFTQLFEEVTRQLKENKKNG